jgi:hypothetical protein
LLLKITTCLLFRIPLLNLYPYFFRSDIFLDILICYGNLKIEKPCFPTVNFEGNYDERSPEDADIKPPRDFYAPSEAYNLVIDAITRL